MIIISTGSVTSRSKPNPVVAETLPGKVSLLVDSFFPSLLRRGKENAVPKIGHQNMFRQPRPQGLLLVNFQNGEDPGAKNAGTSARWSMANSQNADTTLVICGVSVFHSMHRVSGT